MCINVYKVRIIPRLDIKGPNVVKGIHLEGLRVLGSPTDFSQYYFAQGADEIFYMDCVASLYERNSLSEIVEATAKKIFIPITVGGGLRSVDDIRNILICGADKVCINTAAVKNPSFISEAAKTFGSSTIVVAIEAIKQSNGQYLAFIDNGRQETGKEVVDWARQVAELGAGEIVITSVDREGTGEGFDFNLIRSITRAVKIPVVAHGGALSPKNTAEMVKECGVHGICIASAFHYDAISTGAIDRSFNSSREGNTSFLNSGGMFGKINSFDLKSLRKTLVQNNIPTRSEVGL